MGIVKLTILASTAALVVPLLGGCAHHENRGRGMGDSYNQRGDRNGGMQGDHHGDHHHGDHQGDQHGGNMNDNNMGNTGGS